MAPLAALKSFVCVVLVTGSATSNACLLHDGPPTLACFLISCMGSPACPVISDTAVDTSSDITIRDLQEKKEIEEEVKGRAAPTNGNTNEENRKQEADNEVDEEDKEEGEDGEEDDEAEAAAGTRAAEDDKDDNINTKKQNTNEDDQTAKKAKLNLTTKKATMTYSPPHFQSQNVNMITAE